MNFLKPLLLCLALGLGLIGSNVAKSQQPNAAQSETQQPEPLHPLEPADTSSPANTLDSLIDSCNKLHELVESGAVVDDGVITILPTMERILDCMDLSELPKQLRQSVGIESALFLKEVLDRIELPAAEDIPTYDPEGEDSEDSFVWQIPKTRISIESYRVGPDRVAYRFAPETVRRAPEYYRVARNLPYRETGRTVSPGLRDAFVIATKQLLNRTNTASPRGTLSLFIDSCNELYVRITQDKYFDRSDPELNRLAEQILSCLDTSQLPKYAREYFDAEAAVCLKEVLDRTPLPPSERIPGLEAVESTAGKSLSRWQIPRTQIVITKIPDGPRRGEYLFSAGTVARAPKLYDRVADREYKKETQHRLSEGFYNWWLSSPGHPIIGRIVEYLPESFQRRFLGVSIWQAICLLVAIPSCLFAMFWLFSRGRRQGEQVRNESLLGYWLSFGWIVLGVCIPLIFKHVAWEYLTIRGTATYIINFCSDLVFLVCIVGLVVAVSSRAADSIVALPQIAPKSLDASLVRILCRVLGIVAAVIVFLEGGRYLGFQLTTLLASAGIGGLAVALSAQGLIKGLFGTVTILLDKPYRVGERIVVNGHDGFVQEIGLRSTKIRALTGSVIAIPNDQMADAEIENVGQRQTIRRMSQIRIPIDTPREKVDKAVNCIREILVDHEGMTSDYPPRVFFEDFDPEAFIIRIIYWYSPPEYWDFMALNERINMKIFSAFDEYGIQFSLPMRHTYRQFDGQTGALAVELRQPTIADQTDSATNPHPNGEQG